MQPVYRGVQRAVWIAVIITSGLCADNRPCHAPGEAVKAETKQHFLACAESASCQNEGVL
jgi:hypothetical protein